MEYKKNLHISEIQRAKLQWGTCDFSAVLNIKVFSLHIKSLLLIFGIKIVFGYFLLDKAKQKK